MIIDLIDLFYSSQKIYFQMLWLNSCEVILIIIFYCHKFLNIYDDVI